MEQIIVRSLRNLLLVYSRSHIEQQVEMKEKSDSVKMSGTLCRQKHRNRGEKGKTHELIGPGQASTVPYSVLTAWL